MEGLRHKKGKAPKLKIAGDNVNLGLCDSCDFFDNPLLIGQTD